jgi:hypothetical protein
VPVMVPRSLWANANPPRSSKHVSVINTERMRHILLQLIGLVRPIQGFGLYGHQAPSRSTQTGHFFKRDTTEAAARIRYSGGNISQIRRLHPAA